MINLEVFLKGIQNGNYKRIEWIRSILCLVTEETDTWKEEPYPYRVVQQRDGYYFVNPDKEHTLERITDANVSEPLIKGSDVIELKAGDLINLSKSIKTTVGNVLINAIAIIYPFGDKIPFMEGRLTVKDIEKIIVKKLADNPPAGTDLSANKEVIYISEYLNFTKAMLYIRSLSDITIPTASEKLMTAPPGVEEYRKKLMEENKDRLKDPAVLAAIDKKLVEFDTDYLKDDDNAQGFLLKKKLRNEVRRKQFLTVGGQVGFGDGIEVQQTEKSLKEGMSVDSFAISNSSSRVGSYNRGHETMLGGAQFKDLLRAATNAQIAQDDCGTKEGLLTNLTELNISSYIGFYTFVDGKTVEITEDNKAQFINKKVPIRSAMYCKSPNVDYCKKCLGNRLSLHPEAIAVAVSDIGSTFLSLFLAKMHVTGQDTAKLDINETIT